MGIHQHPETVEVGLAELHRNTSDVVRRVQSGQELVVTVSGRPAIRLLGIAQKKTWVTGTELSSIFASLPPWGARERDEEFLDEAFGDPWEDAARKGSEER